MAQYEYDDFWVEFSPRAGGGYEVAARAPDGETATSQFVLPLTDEQLEQAVRTLGSTRAATTRDIGEVTTERRLTAEQLGGTLASALFAGKAGELYTAARSAAVEHSRGVRLWLSLGKTPGLLSVPWEFLYLQPTFLASQRKTPIVRFLRTDAPVAPRRIEKEVRILGVIASPAGLPALKVELEKERVNKALAKARENREVTVDWLDPATPKALRLKLQEGDYHILHFVGHSGYVEDGEGDDGGGVIYLENENHSQAPISDSQLVNLLGDQESLRLVVLNSCEGARTSVKDPFAGIATSIVALGIPAVVAMQFEISDDAAIAFAEELYGSLIAREDTIDVAVAEARKAVFTEVNETEWATPVLFLRNEDGRLFDFVPIVAAAAGAAGAAAGAAGTTSAGTTSAAGVPPAAGAGGGAPPGVETPIDPLGVPRIPTGPATIGTPLINIPNRMGLACLIVAVTPLVFILLLGAASIAAAIFGGHPPSESPGSSNGAIVLPSASEPPETEAPSSEPTVEPTPEPTAELTPAAFPTVPGVSPVEWAGPRPKSNLLIAAGAQSSTISHLGTVVPDAGADGQPAGTATDKAGVYDTDPTWIPKGAVVAFTRVVGDTSEIQYVVPGVGKQPDGARDAGISVKDPIDGHPASGVREHAPAWLDENNLLFARTGQCAPGRGCAEDIMESRFSWIGDYVQDATEPTSVSSGWSDIRHLSVNESGDRVLVTGRNEQAGGEDLGVWVVDASDTRTLLPGSVGVTYAVFGHNGSILGLTGGDQTGWGPVIAVWSGLDAPSPGFVDAFAVLGTFAGKGNVPGAASGAFGWLSVAPDGSGRYAVLIAEGAAKAGTRRPLVIGLLDPDLRLRQVLEPRAPTGTPKVTWNSLVALAW